jgi:4-hydroxybenzoate polyprenyltransferase
METTSGGGLGERFLLFGHMVRFSHSVFALPFALSGVLFAIHEIGYCPGPMLWVWVVVAMVGARSAAMAFNRIADHRLDAANPRTRNRELPRGAMSLATAWAFTLAAAAAFVLACAMLNPLALALSPLALAIVAFYSFTKRFTWTSHLFLGLGLGVAPVGGWVAVTGRLDAAPFLVAAGVIGWVAGFDVFYALQDVDFDRKRGLHSIPARFGPRGAVIAARGLHLAAVLALTSVAFVLDLSPWYLVGMAVIAGLLLYEHRLVRTDDLSRIDKAFFDMNAVVSVVYFFTAVAGTRL